MNGRRIILFLAISTLAPRLSAQDQRVKSRADVDGMGKVALKILGWNDGTEAKHPTWHKDVNKHDKIILVERNVDHAWERVEIRFVPAKDGEVKIRFKGQHLWKKGPDGKRKRGSDLERIWQWVDDVSVTVDGKETLKNGGFEELDGSGTPKHWKMNKDHAHRGEQTGHGGNVCIGSWHNATAAQDIDVKAGKTYILTYWVAKLVP